MFAFLLVFITLPTRAGELALKDRREIRAAILTTMARQSIPGLSTALAVRGELAWTEGFGLADVENQVAATEDTVYGLASISKPITAVAIMQLAEEGKIDIDAPIQTYVPDFPTKPWPVTTRQLLGHLGGIRHYNSNHSSEEFASTRHYQDVKTPLDIFKDDPLLHEPGTKYSYTTYGYCLLGCAVERAGGEPYLQYVSRRIFRRAKMDRIRDDDIFALIPHRAQGYTIDSEGALRNSGLADTSNRVPGGGFVATAADLVRFAIAVQDGTLVKPETRAAMFTRQTLKDGTATRYGLGWMIGEFRGRKAVSHSGAQQRVSTFLLLIPSEGLAVSVMCNLEQQGKSLARLANRLAEIALGLTEAEPAERSP
jgi:serine beta-lactamase-like protein LACTB, mitochondrial